MPADQSDEVASWLESRRLIIEQLARTDRLLRELSDKIDRFNDAARQRSIEMSEKAQDATNALNLRVAMLETMTKVWGGVIGLFAGGIATVLMELILKGIGAKP